MDHETPVGLFADTAPDPPLQTPDIAADVPASLGVLPDGRETVVIGDVSKFADLNHQQGDNPYGFKEDCGLCSCGDVLDQFGVNVTEADVVDHAVKNHECNIIQDDPTGSGGTTVSDQVRVLNDYGVPAHAEQQQSLDDLAGDVERGSGVIIEANAGSLWDDASYFEHGQTNHAVAVTGVARDPNTGEIEGFYINDSGNGQAAKFVDASTMTNAWVDTGGTCVVTDVVHTNTGAVPTAAGR